MVKKEKKMLNVYNKAVSDVFGALCCESALNLLVSKVLSTLYVHILYM